MTRTWNMVNLHNAIVWGTEIDSRSYDNNPDLRVEVILRKCGSCASSVVSHRVAE